MKNQKPLRLGESKSKAVSKQPEPKLVRILNDAAIDAATLKDLRVAYRELRALHQQGFEEMVGRRVKEVLQRLRKEDKKLGGHRPLGFIVDNDRKLQPDERERQISTIAKEQRDQGKTLRAIAAYLEERGFLSRNNKRFEAVQIKRFIERAPTFTAAES